MRLTSLILAFTAGAILNLADIDPARADAIDGDWCSKDGRLMSITRTHIVMPDEKQIRGLYDRHAYTYRVPDEEEGAGSKVFMILANPKTIHLWRDEASAKAQKPPAEVWHRCSAHVS
jgi:hypothetical protein